MGFSDMAALRISSQLPIAIQRHVPLALDYILSFIIFTCYRQAGSVPHGRDPG
jgi:hypothetical protein